MQSPVRITRMPRGEFHRLVRNAEIEKISRVLEPQLPLLKLSRFLRDRRGMDALKPVPECVTCGACCNFASVVPVKQTEARQLDEFIEITLDGTDDKVTIDAVLPRNIETGSCIHLTGELGKAVGCNIYERRPSSCRHFESGSPRCHEYRRIYGFEPQLTAEEKEIELRELAMLELTEKIVDVAIVEDGRVQCLEQTPNGINASESISLKMFAFLPDEIPYEIHTYYASEERWYQNELLGMTLDEASAFVAAKKV